MKTSKTHKYRPTICLLAILLAGSAYAQDRRVEISPFVGVQFGGRILSRPGQLEIEPDLAYEMILDVRVREDATIQMLYGRQTHRKSKRAEGVGEMRNPPRGPSGAR